MINTLYIKIKEKQLNRLTLCVLYKAEDVDRKTKMKHCKQSCLNKEKNWTEFDGKYLKNKQKLVVSLLIYFAKLKCALKKRPYTKKWTENKRNLKTATTIRLIKFKIFTKLKQYELKL